MNTTEDMNTRLTKEDQAIIKEARRNKVSGPIYSEDGLRLLKVLGNPEYLEVKDGVKAICDDACQGLDNLHEVVLPASVTDLGTRAFASCIKLFKITMPGVDFIGIESFAHCENLKEIALPETLGKIWEGAFAGCKALEEINIPSHLKIIDKSAFRNSGLKSLNIVISDDCECCIYDKAFASCKHLESVYLNKNVKIVERMAFAGCTSLMTIGFENPSLTGPIGEFNALTKDEKELIAAELQAKYDFVGDFYPKCIGHGIFLYRITRYAKGEICDIKYGIYNSVTKLLGPCVYNFLWSFEEGGIARAKRNFKSGWINMNSEEIIPCKYSDVSDMENGYAHVKENKDDTWGLVSMTGKVVVPCNKYEDARIFKNGYAGVRLNNLWGFVNEEGEEVIPCQYVDVKKFTVKGFMKVLPLRGDWITIDKTGKQVTK